MSLERVRFLHSSDWQLEQPLGGVAEVPAELHDEFLRAPYRAAERVVEGAIRERVDFVVLTGNLLCLDAASPHVLEFLLQQFERLAEQQIAVYWLGGAEDDPDLWPAQLELPASVHTFPVGRVEQVTHVRDGETIAVLVGQSYRRDTAFPLPTTWAVARRRGSPWCTVRCRPNRWRPRESVIGHSEGDPGISPCWRGARPRAMPAVPRVACRSRRNATDRCWWS